MAEMNKVPAIRFRGFSDEWVNSALGEVAEIKSGSTPLRSNPIFYENGNIPWVKTTDLNNSFITYTEEKITTHAKARVNPPNSVLVAMYGGFNQIGRTGLLAVPAATNQALSVLNTNENEVVALYLLTWLNAKVDFWRMLAGSSRKDPNITGSDVSAFPIIFPKAKEQTQIGSYFQHLDKLISLHQTKVNKLTNLKKAMLEKMFPKQGADVPEIRFKGFAGAWEVRELGDVVKITMGQSPNGINYTNNPDDHILVQGNADMKNGKVVPRVWTREVTKSAEAGDLIMSVRAPVGEIGKTSFNVVIGRGVAAIKGNEFIFQSLKKMNDDGYWKRFSAGSTFDSINSSELSKAVIFVTGIDEQEKIGAYFQNLDKTITLHQTELEKLNNLKKACLEKMFV